MRVFLRGAGALAVLATLLLGVVAAAVFLIRDVGHQLFHAVDPTVAAAAVTAMSTVIVSVATLVIGRYFERRKTLEAELRASKIPIYARLVAGIFGVLHSPTDTQRAAAAEALFRDLTPDLITSASDDVLISWSRFRRSLTTTPPDEGLFVLEKALLAIRRDYGHTGKNVREGDLLGLFIKDIDEYIAGRRATHPAEAD
ncbi:hypothetical protein P3T36_006645 [Kitasatospora sp. MAP12-15]|uniref:hypothetical protein n=1 Tax=unclassified Kitasatospora TaxID=2633591 RepID=UPI002473F835|nr:hypothetical protein [Kitasatospora sp. MAP12-44]MDH6110148.1 hypothetical protein [Kitasatospora sp. MAP12-44]